MTTPLTLTLADLERWERPDSGSRPGPGLASYWAYLPHRPAVVQQQYEGRFALPSARVNTPKRMRGPLTVWVDTVEGWLWTVLPKDPEAWYGVPRWVQFEMTPRAQSQGPEDTAEARWHPVLVRRPLAEGEGAALLDHGMPPAEAYGDIPADWAQALRLGGWYPHDITVEHAIGLPLGERRLWWRIEDEQDVAALAVRPPQWWRHEGWVLDREPRDTAGGPLARHLSVLREAGIAPQAVTVHRRLGLPVDLATLRAAADPVVPDDATRVRLTGDGGRPYYALTAETARGVLARQDPGREFTLVREVYAESVPGLRPLHVDPARHLVVWSDGLVAVPAEVYQHQGHIGGSWPDGMRRLEAAARLVQSCTEAANWSDLEQERPWENWLDATGVASATVDSRTAHAHGASRTVTLTRHTVTRPDGTGVHLWEVAVVTAAPQHPHPDGPGRRTFHTSQDAAREVFAAEDDGLPPVMTVTELAQYLGTARDALRQALRRSRRTRHGQAVIDIPVLSTAQAEPGWTGRTGTHAEAEADSAAGEPNTRKAHLYDPRAVRRWWDSRPGHGPGRGHKQ
ncbi:hypothetical protein AB0G74_30510 [Streptomyces sp. NPDC020875]|uniref:hypothetical protein n=1 Tax=Streptomyces sp. NPDC020875 TaxID=3154898 RepID=UPI0033E9BE32